jgi:hypothetical protein
LHGPASQTIRGTKPKAGGFMRALPRLVSSSERGSPTSAAGSRRMSRRRSASQGDGAQRRHRSTPPRFSRQLAAQRRPSPTARSPALRQAAASLPDVGGLCPIRDCACGMNGARSPSRCRPAPSAPEDGFWRRVTCDSFCETARRLSAPSIVIVRN